MWDQRRGHQERQRDWSCLWGGPLDVEAMVLYRDIGFVTKGLPATIKVDAFPFTRYGVLTGRLTDVSNDATADEQFGLVYPARVSLSQTRMRIDARDVPLSAGMAVTIEIKTGHRRLIEYFLSPQLQVVDEAVMSEREAYVQPKGPLAWRLLRDQHRISVRKRFNSSLREAFRAGVYGDTSTRGVPTVGTAMPWSLWAGPSLK